MPSERNKKTMWRLWMKRYWWFQTSPHRDASNAKKPLPPHPCSGCNKARMSMYTWHAHVVISSLPLPNRVPSKFVSSWHVTGSVVHALSQKSKPNHPWSMIILETPIQDSWNHPSVVSMHASHLTWFCSILPNPVFYFIVYMTSLFISKMFSHYPWNISFRSFSRC